MLERIESMYIVKVDFCDGIGWLQLVVVRDGTRMAIEAPPERLSADSVLDSVQQCQLQ